MYTVLRSNLGYELYYNHVFYWTHGSAEVKFANHSIQFNSKTLFKEGDPVSLQLILGPSKHVNNTTVFHTYIQNNTGSSDKHRQTQFTLSDKNISINTHT